MAREASRTFGEEFRSVRIRAGKTLRDVAVALGNKSVPYASDIERGNRNPPPPPVLRVVLDQLGCSEQYDHLADLAMQYRGGVQLSPSTQAHRRLLIALEREMDSGELSDSRVGVLLESLVRKERLDG